MMDEDGYRNTFSHSQEHAEAGLYTVTMDDPSIAVALTATPNSALHRYRFSDGVAEPTVILDLGHTLQGGSVMASSITVDASGDVTGALTADGGLGGTFNAWFRLRFNEPIMAHGGWTDGTETASTGSGVKTGAWFRFDAPEVMARIRVSLVGPPAALSDEEDLPVFDFEANVSAVQDAWRNSLGVFSVWGGSEDEQVRFATALYHTQLMPQILSDDGFYPGFDAEVHPDEGHPFYSDFSLWDTYRTTHPLYTLGWPNRHRDMLLSLLRMVEQSGQLPRWPLATSDSGSMIGQPAGIVLGEAAAKGLTVEAEGVDLLLRNAVGMGDTEGRPHETEVLARGYFAADEMGGSVSWTQEMAIADHALALLAEAHGEADTAAVLREQSGWWQNVFNPETGWFQGRLMSGEFEADVEESYWSEAFVEGNARQYLWLVPHDPEGLFSILGGKTVALERLELMMSEGALELESAGYSDALYGTWYWHGNEPGLHIPWLIALAGEPDTSRRWVRWLRDNVYSSDPDGLAGNDDGGTLSAWYVWAAMGVYPLAGSDTYVLGAPLFDRIEVTPDDGSEAIIITRSGDGDHATISRNGSPFLDPDLVHAQLNPGTRWHFELE
jgi:predicted alpha-1,2-mannosidase